VQLDIIDPVLAQADFAATVSQSLEAAGVRSQCQLIGGMSPEEVHRLGRAGKRWSLIFIDGNHEAPGPEQDAVAVEAYAEPDAAILFHDLAAPAVADGLRHLRNTGWNVLVYLTMQIMAVAWRGKVQPLHHVPDPVVVNFPIPDHLAEFPISGLPNRPLAKPVAPTIQAQRLSTGAYAVTFGRRT
jgi:hypothetical protein